jgi:hypothetical protein
MHEVAPDTPAAIDFLHRYEPEGLWLLTAIRPDRKAIDTRTFRPGEEDDLAAWLNQYNGNRNIYFSVNQPLRALTKKADREDIAEMRWLHVDIDPRAGEDIDEERSRALGLLTDKLPAGVPAPTAVIFSGGGYQAFWRLEDPVPINGDVARAEDAKRYNQQLEVLFGADNCHDIPRIMRLPGTINVPDERKAKKGRVPTLATLVSMSDAAYPLSRFTPAQAVQMAGDTGFAGSHTVQVPGNVERLADVNELDHWGVPDRAKVIIVQGSHPDEPPKQGDNSRSAWVFDAVCALVRAEVPDDVIFAILTDPDFAISESILEKGGNARKYAIRQIERAHEYAVDPWLQKLNEQFAVIGNIGGKCRVVEEMPDPVLNRSRLTRQSFDDFRNRHMNQYVQVGVDEKSGHPKMKPVGAWWLGHPQRRQFNTITFAPGQEVEGAYNLWKGFAVAARPGELHETFLAHVHDNVCQGDEDAYRYLLGWMARVVQRPGEPGEVAVVLRGGKGTGKSFFAKHLGRLFGRHFLHVSNPSHLVGNFNSHLRDAVLLFADEAFYAGDRKHERLLKTLITEDTLQIEAKGVDVETAPNFVHLIMASNDDHVVRATGDERRFFVLDVGEGQQQQSAYFGRIAADLEAGGYETLLHFLLTYDLADFEVRAVPQTAALKEQKLQTAEPWLAAIISMADEGISPDHDGWKNDRPGGWQGSPGGRPWCGDEVSVAGILEAVGLSPNDRSLQMAVAKTLERLNLVELGDDGKPVKRKAESRCIFERGKPPTPIRGAATYPDADVRRGQRVMYRLRPLGTVRANLATYQAEWDTTVDGWQLRGDE